MRLNKVFLPMLAVVALGMGGAAVANIGEVALQAGVPALAARHMPDNRPEDQIVVGIVTVLEQKHRPARLQDANRLVEQPVTRTVLFRYLMRAESEDHDIAACIFQRNGERGSEGSDSGRMSRP